ncbi:unnamed protein product [Rotaria sp. Silwood2]|nr:unnamed protein product [Rotaria sp. Silwood2]
MTTTASTSSNLPDKDQIRVHVRRDGLIERQRFTGRVWRQLCKYDGGEECQAFVAYRSLCVGHYHQTLGITVKESKRRQLIQQLATAAASSKATTITATMIPSKIRCSIETPLTLDRKSSINIYKQTIVANILYNSSQYNNSNKRRKSDEWVPHKRCRYDSTQNSMILCFYPPVQSILFNTSTTIDESTATFDSNQACSSASSIDSHADDYILAQKSISITATRLTDEQIDRLDQFLQRFNIHYSDEIDEKTTHLITDDTTIPFVCALLSKVVHALARLLTTRGDSLCSTMCHGAMQRPRLLPRRHALFSKHVFMLKCNGVQNVNIILNNVFLRRKKYNQVTRWTTQSKMIVVFCEQSYVQERQDKYWKCVELGIRFCSSESIIESIAQYQVQDYTIYEEEPQQNEDDYDEESCSRM